MAESTVKVVFLGDASKLKGEIDGIDSKVDKSGSVFDGFGKKAALGLGAGGIAAGAAFVHFGQMGNALDAMGKKAATVFEGSKGDIDKWADANAKAFGLTDDQLTGLAANFGDLLKPMGFTADQAAGMSKDVVGLSGALSAWSGGTVSASEASDILAKAMLGERDGLKGLGIAISEADVQARLAKNGTDKLTGAALEQAKAVATQQLIFEKSTDAQKAWADGSMDAIKSQNSIKSSIGELREQLATRLQPAFAAMSTWIVSTGIPAMERFAGFVQSDVVPVVQAMADRVGEAISFLADWWRENWDQIRSTAQTVIENVQAVIQTVLGAIEAFWRTWGGAITTYVESMFGIIRDRIQAVMTIIQGVINVVMGLIRGDWSRVWDGIQQIVDGVWKFIQSLIDQAMATIRLAIEVGMTLVAGVFDAAWEGIKSAASAALDLLVDFMRKLPERILAVLVGLGSLLTGLGLDLINGLGTGIRNAWDGLIMFIESIPGMVLGVFRDAGSWLFQIGKDLIQGLWNGITDVWDKMTGWLGDAAGKVTGTLKKAWNLWSPSRVMYDIGENVSKGLFLGIQKGWQPIPGWLDDVGESMVGRASEMSDAMTSAVADMGGAMVESMSSSMDTMVGVVAAGAKRAVDAWYPAIIAIDEQYRNNEPGWNADPEGVLDRANEERRRAISGAASAAGPVVNLTQNFNGPITRTTVDYAKDNAAQAAGERVRREMAVLLR